MPGQFEVMIERNFSSAHQLRGYKGKCENLHGHNYKIEIYARGSELNHIGLLVDFVELKEAADELVTPIYITVWRRFGVDEAWIEREVEIARQEVAARYGR